MGYVINSCREATEADAASPATLHPLFSQLRQLTPSHRTRALFAMIAACMEAVNVDNPLLDEVHAAFIQGGVAIIAAATTAGNIPAVARVSGCRVSEDRRTVTVLLLTERATGLLEAVRASRRIAVVFTLPHTHRSIQLKGDDASIVPLQPDDQQIHTRYADAFVAEVCPLGYDEPVIHLLVTDHEPELTAITFTVSHAFEQTPGPNAGTRLKCT